jgi:hypothetical protein
LTVIWLCTRPNGAIGRLSTDTDGILKSNRVLSCLSKHSTGDPGVCREEIAIVVGVKGGSIQTVLVESEQ